METKHTPTPYALVPYQYVSGKPLRARIHGPNNEPVIDDANPTFDDAEFIVRACNGHHELLDACEAAVRYLDKVKELAEGLSALVPSLPPMTIGNYASELHTVCSNTRKIRAAIAKSTL